MLKLACLIVTVFVVILVMTGYINIEPKVTPMVMFGALTSAIILTIARI